MVKWDVGRPAHRPPGRLAAMRSLTDCRCRGRRPRRPAKGQGFSLQNEPRKGHVGRPAPRPPRTLAAARKPAGRRGRGRRPRRPAEVSGGGRYTGGMNPSPTCEPLAGVSRKAAEGSRPLPTGQKIKGWQWRGSVNGLRTRGAREGGSPPLCSGRRLPGNGLQRTARRNPPVT